MADADDTTPPSLEVNGQDMVAETPSLTATQESPDGTPVTFALSSIDNAGTDISGSITCMNDDGDSIASGDTFPAGDTNVTCDVTDEAANQTQGSFTITVNDLSSADAAAYDTDSESALTTGETAGGFEHGWSWVIHVTLPFKETRLKMKFDDFSDGAGGTLSALGNVQFYSPQATAYNSIDSSFLYDSDTTDEDGYSNPVIALDEDADTNTAGRQIAITVQVQIPEGTPTASYSGNWSLVSSAPPPGGGGGFNQN